MRTLETRLARLEATACKVNFDDLTDEELSSHIAGLPFKSAEGYKAIISLVLRHPSTIPIVSIDPDHAGADHEHT